MDATLPELSHDAQAASRDLSACIASCIRTAGGWLPFADYMDMALHLPGLGYYAGGSQKFGASSGRLDTSGRVVVERLHPR